MGQDAAAFGDNPTEHADGDGDGIGDNADADDDGDGSLDSDELERGTDPARADTDDDGTNDLQDVCPVVAFAVDSDGDGVCPPQDQCPTMASSADILNLDGDALCDGADPDDDGDGDEDGLELAAGSDPRRESSVPVDIATLDPNGDFDRDGLTNGQEGAHSASPYFADTDADGSTDYYEVFSLPATSPASHSSQPRAILAVTSSLCAIESAAASLFDPDLEGVDPLGTPVPVRATVTGGQATPVAVPGSPQTFSAGEGIVALVGFQPQTLLGRDLDGDGLAGAEEAGLRTSSTNVDTDGDRFADGAGATVPVAQVANGWDLDGDGKLDGEGDFETNPADQADHPGKPGDVAPLGHPDGKINAADATVGLRIVANPAITDGLGTQNAAIAEMAADANSDSEIRADDALKILQEAVSGE